jgi:hypothetical protein
VGKVCEVTNKGQGSGRDCDRVQEVEFQVMPGSAWPPSAGTKQWTVLGFVFSETALPLTGLLRSLIVVWFWVGM